MKTKEMPDKADTTNRNTRKDKLNSFILKGLLVLICVIYIYELIIVKL